MATVHDVAARPKASSIVPITTGVLALSVIALLLPRLLLFMQVTTTFISWPWQFDYTEGVNLNATMQLAQGQNIYRHNGPEAFISAPYPPIFYLLNAPVTWLAGPSFGFGRTLSLLATVALAVLIVYAVRRVTSKWLSGALAGILWLSLTPVIIWGALYTQHIIALMFGFAGLVWAMLHPSGRRLYIAALLFALAFYTKQSAIDAAGATILWLFVINRRTGLRFAFALVMLVGIPFIGANLLLKGGLWEHVFSNQALPWSGRRFQRLLGRLWGEYWPVLGLGTACTLGTMAAVLRDEWKAKSRKLKVRENTFAFRSPGGPWALAVLYFVVAQASVLVRLGRAGVNYNHMIDALLPACLLTGLSLGYLSARLETWKEQTRTDNRGSTRKYLGVIYATVLLGAILLAQTLSLSDPRTWYSGGWPNQSLDRQMQTLSKLVSSTPGDIYSEDEYLALRNGRRVLYDDPFMFVNLAEQGRWDDSLLTQSIKDRRFGLIFLQQGSTRWTAAGQQAFNDSYDLKFPDVVNTYVPKLRPLTPQYSLSCNLVGQSDDVKLEGYSLEPGIAWNGIKPGDTLRLTLYWKASHAVQRDYASFAQLINGAGDAVAAQDNPQTGASQPSTKWKAGETVTDDAALPLKVSLPAGRYRLIAGMYRVEAGVLQPLVSSCKQGEKYGNAVLLGSVDVK